MAPALLEAMPAEVYGIAKNFYKFWTDRWKTYTFTCDAADLTKAMVSKSVRALGQEALTDIQTRNKSSIDKWASAKEKLK